MALGSIIIYVFGAGWLAHQLNVPIATGDTNALSLGVTPFLVGDLASCYSLARCFPQCGQSSIERSSWRHIG